MDRSPTFYRVVREGLTEKATSEQRHKGGEDWMEIWPKGTPARTEHG